MTVKALKIMDFFHVKFEFYIKTSGNLTMEIVKFLNGYIKIIILK